MSAPGARITETDSFFSEITSAQTGDFKSQLMWFRSHLEGRGYILNTDNYDSTRTTVTRGVPQGTVLVHASPFTNSAKL